MPNIELLEKSMPVAPYSYCRTGRLPRACRRSRQEAGKIPQGACFQKTAQHYPTGIQ